MILALRDERLPCRHNRLTRNRVGRSGGGPIVGATEYKLVEERFAIAKEAFAAVQAAHRRGDLSGPELVLAVTGVREAVLAFRQPHSPRDATVARGGGCYSHHYSRDYSQRAVTCGLREHRAGPSCAVRKALGGAAVACLTVKFRAASSEAAG